VNADVVFATAVRERESGAEMDLGAAIALLFLASATCHEVSL